MNNPLSVAAVALVCLTTLIVGGLGLRMSRRTSDFYVAGRTVSPRMVLVSNSRRPIRVLLPSSFFYSLAA